MHVQLFCQRGLTPSPRCMLLSLLPNLCWGVLLGLLLWVCGQPSTCLRWFSSVPVLCFLWCVWRHLQFLQVRNGSSFPFLLPIYWAVHPLLLASVVSRSGCTSPFPTTREVYLVHHVDKLQHHVLWLSDANIFLGLRAFVTRDASTALRRRCVAFILHFFWGYTVSFVAC